MHVTRLPLFSLLLSLAASSACALEMEPSSGCLVVVGTNTIELGSIVCDKTVTVPFRIRNVTTNKATVVTLVPTCSCITGTIDKPEIPPQGEATVQVTLDPASVRGAFHRSIWVRINAQLKDNILLTLAGDAVPMFTGGPDAPVPFIADRPGQSLTNRFTLSATKPGLTFGSPVILTNENLVLNVALLPQPSTNAALSSYEVQMVVKPLSNGFHTAGFVLPVFTGSQEPAPSIRYLIHARVGAKLSAAPSALVVPSTDQPLEARLRIMAELPGCDPAKLTWSPKVEGLEVTVTPGTEIKRALMGHKMSGQATQRRSSMTVMLKLSPEALKTLVARNDPELRFDYPSHSPVFVRLVQLPNTSAP